MGHLTALRRLDIRDCEELERLPDIRQLTRLESLLVCECGSLRLWKGFEWESWQLLCTAGPRLMD